MGRRLTIMEYSILKPAAAGGVWVSFTKGDQIDTAQKLTKEGYLVIDPKDSTTSGISFRITSKGRECLEKNEAMA